MLPVEDRMSQEMDGDYIRVYEANRRSDLVEWLNCLLPELRLPLDAAEGELREILFDGTVLCSILGKIDARFMEECQGGDEYSIEQDNDNIRRFLSAINEMGLPTFSVSDLEQGSISAVIECLLCLRDHLNLENGKCYAQCMNSNFNGGSLSRKRWEILDTDRLERTDTDGGHCLPNRESSPFSTEERRKNFLESKVQHIMQMQQSPITSGTMVTIVAGNTTNCRGMEGQA